MGATTKMSKRMLFMGEKRSQQAIDNGWHWYMGVSTAKVLFDSLRQIGIDPEKQDYMNLWSDSGVLQKIPKYSGKIVAMGQKVQAQLDKMGIKYIGIVHPAARGKWRKREVYVEHLEEQLLRGSDE